MTGGSPNKFTAKSQEKIENFVKQLTKQNLSFLLSVIVKDGDAEMSFHGEIIHSRIIYYGLVRCLPGQQYNTVPKRLYLIPSLKIQAAYFW